MSEVVSVRGCRIKCTARQVAGEAAGHAMPSQAKVRSAVATHRRWSRWCRCYVGFPLCLPNVKDGSKAARPLPEEVANGVEPGGADVRQRYRVTASESECGLPLMGAVGVDGPRRHRCAILRSLQILGKEAAHGTD